MFRKVLNVAIAASVALSPLAATAQEYRFRYVAGKMTNMVPPVDEPEIGIGNDIQAYFVSVVDTNFNKEIPVATRDVRVWRVEEGILPEGISLDPSTGIISGVSTAAQKTEILLLGYDINGNRIAKAQIYFTTVRTEGQGMPISYYGHTDQYFYANLPSPDGIEVTRWEPIDLGNPAPGGMSTEYGAYSGAPGAEGSYDLLFQGYDAFERKVAYAYGPFLVQNGPKVEFIDNQTVDKSAGKIFNRRPTVHHKIGTLSYKLVPVDARPTGLEFNSTTGRIAGVYDEFETSAQFRIEARDSADGTTGLSNVFTLETMPARINIPYLQTYGLTATLGKPYSRTLQPNTESVDIKFAIVGGKLPSGIQMSDKGVFTGTPDVLETQMVTLRISGDGATDKDIPFEFRVKATYLSVSQETLHARINEPFETKPIKVNSGLVDPMTYESTPTVPEITFDPTKLTFSSAGIATAGSKNQMVNVTNGANDTYPRSQYIRIWPELKLTYAPNTDVIRDEWNYVRPTFDPDALRGEYRFQIEQGTLPSWLTFSRGSGRFTSNLKDIKDVTGAPLGPFVVSVTDDFGVPVRSEPFTITAVDRKPILLTENKMEFQYNVYDYVRPVKSQDTIGTRTFTLISGASQFDGTGVRFLPDGYFWGRITAPVGTEFTNLIVRVEDADGPTYAKEYGPFTMKVVEQRPPVSLDGTFNRDFTWTEDRPFAGLKMPLFTDYNGVLTYEFGAGAPEDLAFANGELTGFIADPTETGKPIELPYTIKDTYGRTANGLIKLTILPAMSIAPPEATTVNRGNPSTLKTVTTNGIAPFTYSLAPNSQMPAGMQLNTSTGAIEGTPSVEGLNKLVVIVTDKTGASKNTGEFSILVDKPLPFSISYTEAKMTLNTDGTIKATVVGAGTETGWQHLSGKLPLGIDFIDQGDFGGSFSGIPLETGIFPDIQVLATNKDTGITAPTSLTITVLPEEALAIESQTLKTRVTTASKTINLPIDNSIGKVTFAFEGGVNPFPGQLILSESGVLTYSFSEPGTFSGITVTARDEAGQEATGTISLETIASPTVAVESSTLREYETIGTAFNTANIIGTATYSVEEGSTPLPSEITIDQTTGKLTGSPSTTMTVDGIRIRVTDSHDGLHAVSDPFSITVMERAPLAADPVIVASKQFAPISGQVSFFQNVGDVTFTVAPALPDQITFDYTTGAFTGKFDETYSGAFKVTITDSKGGLRGTTTVDMTVDVAPRDQLTLSTPAGGAPKLKQHQAIATGTKLFDVSNALAAVEFTITPALPDTLTLTADGVISGKPTAAKTAQTYTIVATDKLGGALGTSTYNVSITIDPRDPLGLAGPTSFTFNQHFPGYFDLVQSNAIDSFEYSAVTALPGDLSLDAATGRVSGTPVGKFAATPFTFRVTDGVGDTKDFTSTLTVADRLAPAITANAEQPALLDYDFGKTLETENVLGETTWTLVSGTLPPGVGFDTATGSFNGKPTQFGTFPNIVIGLSDTFDGATTKALNKTFSIIVKQDGSAIVLSPASGTARVNQPFALPALTATNTVGNITWSATGLDNSGLTFNAKDGTIFGTPRAVGQVTATITIKDITGRSEKQAVVITVNPLISLQAVTEADLLFNYSPEDALYVQPIATNLHSAAVWSITGGENLPDGMTFNTATGKFEGVPLEIGAFGPTTVTVADDLPGTTSSQPIWFTVYMNDDPIALTLADFIGKVGYPISTVAPVISNNLGPATFFSNELAGKPIKVDRTTGVVSGTYTSPIDLTFNVSVTDTTNRVTSKPLRMQILPRMNVYAAAQSIIPAQEKMTPIKVNRQNVVGTAVWNPVPVELLPEGVTFNTTLGQFEGEAKLLGDWGPIKVSSTDSLGDTGTSNDIYLKVQAGSTYLNLLAGQLTDAEKRTAYSFDMRQFVDPKTVGIDVSEIAWSLSGATPPGVGINTTTGMLTGIPSLSGTYTFDVVGSVKGKERARKAYTLAVKLPEIKIALGTTTLPVANLALSGKDHSVKYDFSTAVDFKGYPLADVTYYVEPAAVGEGLPKGLAISGKGQLSGTATDTPVGDYKFRLTAVFKHNTDEHIWSTQSFTIKVEDILSFAYKPMDVQKLPDAEKGVAYSFDLRNLIADDIKGIRKDELTWTVQHIINEESSTIPNLSGDVNNSITNNVLAGTSRYAGYRDMRITAKYADRSIVQVYRFTAVLPPLGMKLSTNENAVPALKLRELSTKFFDFHTLVSDHVNIATNAVSFTGTNDVTIKAGEIAGLPPGMTIGTGTTGSTSGWLTGTPTAAGTYRVKVTANYKKGSGDSLEEFSTSQDYLIVVESLDMKFDSIVAGASHACGVATDGKAYCWGYNLNYRLGNGSTATAYVPVEVSNVPSNLKKISTYNATTCGLTAGGEAWCWGNNTYGEGGIGATGIISNPRKATVFGTGLKDISVGNTTTCVVTYDDRVQCVGDGGNGRLGNGSTGDSRSAVYALEVTSAKAVSVGSTHACALISDGTVKCWGYNGYGQVTGAGTSTTVSTPVAVAGLPNVKEVQAAENSTCVLTTAGTVYCWGIGQEGRLGSGSTSNLSTPNAIPASYLSSPTSLSYGTATGCTIVAGGTLKCWGNNANGQVGYGSSSGSSTRPVTVKNLTNVQSVSSGGNGTCAIDGAKNAYCWGSGYFQGDGSSTGSSSNEPVTKVGG